MSGGPTPAGSVVLDGGEEISAPLVVSNADYKRTVLELTDRDAWRPETVDRAESMVTTLGLVVVYLVVEGVLEGSITHQRRGDGGFGYLQEQGVRTIISVDAAEPDVALAEAFGMRYVHIPIGYGAVDAKTKLKLTRAVRDLPRPIYVHCHHGKHRGPTAAALALVLGLFAFFLPPRPPSRWVGR